MRLADPANRLADGIRQLVPAGCEALDVLVAVELLELGGHSRKQVFRKHATGFDHLDKLGGGDTGAVSGGLQRARKTLCELPAQFFHADGALADHLAKRQQCTVRVLAALSETRHRSGNCFKDLTALFAFQRCALDAGQPGRIGFGRILQLEAKTRGGLGDVADFLRCFGSASGDGAHRAHQAVEIGGHLRHFAHTERCGNGSGYRL